MRAKISDTGALTLIAQSSEEHYMLKHWAHDFNEDHVTVSIDGCSYQDTKDVDDTEDLEVFSDGEAREGEEE